MHVILPNPFTPMAFLPPEAAVQVTIKNYTTVGITAILVWDVLSNLGEDYKLLTRHPIRFPTIVYFLSRISIIVYIIACVIFDTAPIDHCKKLGQILDWFFPVVQSSTSLLFALRVWAMYGHNYFVRSLVIITWLAVVGSTLTVGLGLEAGNIGTTSYCIYTRSTPYIALTFVVPLIHDTFVFIAITWRLVSNMLVDYNLSRGLRMIVFGTYLPIFSKILLQDGQRYYLTTLTISLITVIIFYLPFSPSYKILLSLPNTVLMNIMACLVYRSTKLGLRNSEESMGVAQLHFKISATSTTRLQRDGGLDELRIKVPSWFGDFHLQHTP
ncbi:hypothetical protein BDN70DRAFT_910127 [Pholiota conissans]|uniref:DUF6533 domain-containing protein n=1 Tax=Pholiota conissans TaxID=109636 RepID=A0A9P5ZGK5_9AGAR|nr:hypothetical protein BDN70DRAFT_910127 [Pholiota conissans]